MARRPTPKKKAAAPKAPQALERRAAVRKLIGNYKDFLFVGGLGGPAHDVIAVTRKYPKAYTLSGAMGAACSIGLGLALAQPRKRVAVFTGDGELLMNVGTLATIGVLNPPNLSIVCVDNGHYGETGFQLSHTSRGVDLEKMAAGAGIRHTMTIERAAQLAEGARLLRRRNATSFILLKVAPTNPPNVPRSRDAAWVKSRFREALLGTA